ncbi:hypothetical protein FB451DRAFT_1376736 [Mycena latifolia]|nr:hypothetical protein FB451DRAFT_1376736 [Mycena latifolia]
MLRTRDTRSAPADGKRPEAKLPSDDVCPGFASALLSLLQRQPSCELRLFDIKDLPMDVFSPLVVAAPMLSFFFVCLKRDGHPLSAISVPPFAITHLILDCRLYSIAPWKVLTNSFPPLPVLHSSDVALLFRQDTTAWLSDTLVRLLAPTTTPTRAEVTITFFPIWPPNFEELDVLGAELMTTLDDALAAHHSAPGVRWRLVGRGGLQSKPTCAALGMRSLQFEIRHGCLLCACIALQLEFIFLDSKVESHRPSRRRSGFEAPTDASSTRITIRSVHCADGGASLRERGAGWGLARCDIHGNGGSSDVAILLLQNCSQACQKPSPARTYGSEYLDASPPTRTGAKNI